MKLHASSPFLLQSIKDRQLFAINGALASVVLLVLVVWQIVSPYQVVVRMLDKEVRYYGGRNVSRSKSVLIESL